MQMYSIISEAHLGANSSKGEKGLGPQKGKYTQNYFRNGFWWSLKVKEESLRKRQCCKENAPYRRLRIWQRKFIDGPLITPINSLINANLETCTHIYVSKSAS